MGLNSEKKKMMAGLFGTVDELMQEVHDSKLTMQEIPLDEIDDLDPAFKGAAESFDPSYTRN